MTIRHITVHEADALDQHVDGTMQDKNLDRHYVQLPSYSGVDMQVHLVIKLVFRSSKALTQ